MIIVNQKKKNNKLRCTTKTVAEIRELAIKRREEEEQRLSKIAEKRHTKKCLPRRSGSKVDCSKCSVFDAPEGSSFGSDEICAVEEGGMDSDAPGQSRCMVHCKPKVCCKKTGFPPLYMEQCRGQGKEVDLSKCTDESGADKKYFSI